MHSTGEQGEYRHAPYCASLKGFQCNCYEQDREDWKTRYDECAKARDAWRHRFHEKEAYAEKIIRLVAEETSKAGKLHKEARRVMSMNEVAFTTVYCTLCELQDRIGRPSPHKVNSELLNYT